MIQWYKRGNSIAQLSFCDCFVRLTFVVSPQYVSRKIKNVKNATTV